MSEPTFEQLRIPAALILIITVVFILLPRSGEEEPTATTATPVADNFQAEVLACRLIAGSSCIGRLGVLPARAGSLTALVRFSDANAGDAISVVLNGPGGTIDGGPYTLQGGGDGYYYSTFTIGGMPNGEYTLVATRNGTEVAQTSFQRGR